MSEGKSVVKWDGTITLGSIIAGLSVALPMIVGAYVAIEKMDGQAVLFREFQSSMTSEMKGVREDISNLKLEMADKNHLSNQVADHEVRIRNLEGRVRE